MKSTSTESIRVYPVLDTLGEKCLPRPRHSGIIQAGKKHARIPWEVGTDERLKDRDVRVYFALASFTRHGPRASAGARWIAKCIHAPKEAVGESLKRLEACGHLEIVPSKRGQRKEYRLKSPIFEYRGEGTPDIERPVMSVECPNCHGWHKYKRRSGLCGKCWAAERAEIEVRRLLKGSPTLIDSQIYLQVRAKGARTLQKAIKKVRSELASGVA